jgi:hypothetical protein
LLPSGEELPPPAAQEPQSLLWPAGPEAAPLNSGEREGKTSGAVMQSIDALEKSSRVWPAANQKPVENVPPNPLRSVTP